MNRDAQPAPDGTTPPFLQAKITKAAHRKTINLNAGQAHDDLPIQITDIESENPTQLKSRKMCASDSSILGGIPCSSNHRQNDRTSKREH
jgi:hypothetical protein